MRTDPVFIVSAPRCGSSLTANIVERCGLVGGQMKAGDSNNAYGYYENTELDKLNIEMLRSQDVTKLGKRYHPTDFYQPYPQFQKKVLDILNRQCVKSDQQWFFKSNKLLFTWRVWLEHFPDARWLLVYRDTDESINSMLRTPFMDAYSTGCEWHLFLEICHRAQEDICIECLQNCSAVNISDVLRGDANELNDALRSIGVQPPINNEHLSCIDKTVWSGECTIQ